MKVARILSCLLVLLLSFELQAQTDTGVRKTDTSTNTERDTTGTPPPRRVTPPRPKPIARDTVKPPITDTTAIIDSTQLPSDSTRKDSVVIVVAPTPVKIDTTIYKQFFQHPYLPFDKPAKYMLMQERIPESRDSVFYLLVGLLFFVAFIRFLFPKYFQNTFRLFFQTTFRQKQTREQLVQENLGSLLLNLLFIVSTAIYVSLVLDFYDYGQFSFWSLLLYSALGLFIIYFGKFLFLNFTGWVFNAKEAAETYIFIVFLINKIIGVMLIPFILIMAFSDKTTIEVAITASLILLGAMFFYRYIISLKSFRRDVKISPLHFFIYLCGVEIAPLLLIGKALFMYIEKGF
jgi:hypothetical protein